MNSILTPNAKSRVVRAALAAGLASAGGPWAVAGEPSAGHVFGAVDVGLVLGTALVVAIAGWGLMQRIRRRLERHTAGRIREMTALIEHAEGLLWEAEVELRPGDWRWDFKLHPSAFGRKLFKDGMVETGTDPWSQFNIETQAEMDARAREAMEQNRPGYEQEFRAERHGRSIWMHENVSIRRLGPNRFWLVGLVTDITPQHEAEEAKRKSELRLSYMLERTDSMIWQAQVTRGADGRLAWAMYIPPSQLYRRIFSSDPVNPRGFTWTENGVPEHAAMEHRALEAIAGGAPGYEQVFHVPRPDGDAWLSEKVSIVATGPEQWDLVGIITDITARHEAEEAWQASQARLGKLLELAECLLWEATVVHEPDDTLRWDLYAQRSVLFRRMFGDRADAVLDWHKLAVPELPEMNARTLHAIKACAPGYSQEFHYEKADGVVWFREAVTMVQLTEHTFRLVGVITDITAQRRAEEAQQQSELRLAALLERADCMIWQGVTHRRGPDDYAWKLFTPRSQLFRRIFGGDPTGSQHFDWTDKVPEFPEMRVRAHQAMAGGETGYEQVFHYQHPRAGDIWLNEKVSIRPLGPDQWELIGIITDITAQHESEVARQASEQRLQDLLSRANCLLWEATMVMTPDNWTWDFKMQPSGLCQKLYGAPQPKPEVGLWRNFDVPEREAMNERCRSAIKEGLPGYEQVFRIRLPGAPVIWISENVTIRRLSEGKYSLVGVAVDITPQRGAEEALAAEKERLAVTLRAMSECVITTDVAGLIQFMNPAAAVLTGWPETAAFGLPVAEICRLQDSGSGQPVAVPVVPVVRSDAVADLPAHTRLLTRAGERRLIDGCCAPIHAADGKVIGTVLVFRDVTEQERLEQELVRATRLESVGVLAGGIAHDFNNILTAVMGNLALAQLDIAPESPAGSSLHSAEKAALRARDLTQQLLTFAKGGEPVRAAVQLGNIVREMAAFALHGSKVKATYDMAPDLWPADADKGQIGRVVQNIVLNAVQAMPKGGTLQIMARNDSHDRQSQPGLQPGKYIQLAITDTGVGIKPENLARIFDPYFTTKQTGTGLGLAAVYSIVKKHRGHIEVESQLGEGTTFRVWLPAMHEHQGSLDSRSPWGGSADRLKGRVLFMDDEASIRTMAEALLTRFGLNVDCAIDGAEAVAKYREALAAGARYDLVIMDLTVPGGMGGLAALGQLRAIDPQVKAVVSSGYSSDPVLANHRAHGFVAVIAKPYEANELSRVLHEVLAGP